MNRERWSDEKRLRFKRPFQPETVAPNPQEGELWKAVTDPRVVPGYEISNFGSLRGPEGWLPRLNHGHQGSLVHYHPEATGAHYLATGLHHADLSAARCVLTEWVRKPVSHRLAGVRPSRYGPVVAPNLFGEPTRVVIHADGSQTGIEYATYVDGNRANLRVENLRWSESVPSCKGEAHGHSKLTADQVRAIRSAPRTYGYQGRLAEAYGVSFQLIHLIIKGKVWTHV